jgi:hypothetical protein
VSLLADPGEPAVTVALKGTLEVLAARMVVVPEGVSATEFSGAVWLTVVAPVAPELDSATLMVQVPGVEVATYVVVACPAAFVVADGVASGVQSAPAVLNSTGSPLTGVPLLASTVAVIVDVAAPLAEMLVGLAAAVTVFGGLGAGFVV